MMREFVRSLSLAPATLTLRIYGDVTDIL